MRKDAEEKRRQEEERQRREQRTRTQRELNREAITSWRRNRIEVGQRESWRVTTLKSSVVILIQGLLIIVYFVQFRFFHGRVLLALSS
jgi:hypothetical protein